MICDHLELHDQLIKSLWRVQQLWAAVNKRSFFNQASKILQKLCISIVNRWGNGTSDTLLNQISCFQFYLFSFSIEFKSQTFELNDILRILLSKPTPVTVLTNLSGKSGKNNMTSCFSRGGQKLNFTNDFRIRCWKKSSKNPRKIKSISVHLGVFFSPFANVSLSTTL